MKLNFSSRIAYAKLFQPAGIVFELLEEATITITITDASGTVLATPVNETHHEKGTHELFFPLPTHVAGALFYGITAVMASGTVTERKKLR